MSTARVRTEKLLDVQLPPSRVATILDSDGLNKRVSSAREAVEEKLRALRMRGNPKQVPQRPKLGDKPSDKERAAHAAALKTYVADFKAYNIYKSNEYKEAKLYFTLLTKLSQAVDINERKKGITPNSRVELDELTALVTGERLKEEREVPVSEKASAAEKKKLAAENAERHEQYIKRLERNGNLSVVYTEVGSPALDNRDALMAAIARIKVIKNVDLFLEKHNINSDCNSVGKTASVAATVVLQEIASELIDHTIKVVNRAREVTIKPEYVIAEGFEDLKYRAFIEGLPVIKTLMGREQRRQVHKTNMAVAKKTFDKEQKNLRKKQASVQSDSKVELPKFTYPSFNEQEVHDGHARVELGKGEKRETKRYYWTGIEDVNPKMEGITDFVAYVARMYAEHIEENNNTDVDIRVSAAVKKVVSDILVQATVCLSMKLQALANYNKNTIVTEGDVKTIVMMMLLDKYYPENGVINLSADHKLLFNIIDSKVTAYKTHHTTRADDSDESDDAEEAKEEDTGVEDDLDEEAPKPKKTGK